MTNNAIPMSQSRTVQTRLVLPPDTNNHNSIFGGRVLAYIDEIAAITAMKHAKGHVVTASIDSVDFLSAAHVGDILEIESIVSSTGRSSMEVYVRVISRNIETGEEKLTTESFVTMVSVDDDGKPKPVPAIYPETDAEKRLFETGPARREHRKQKRALPH
ncbi:acyl-CoA thioesterase [Lysinibacillus agricola]|uniref:Acyl-CoA thioesterase n=1 Tax=Lysinibacillus agricola TaxID=2590012 RepID=A0ABX7AS37_9BACI|nr:MULTISPECIES: acyl-CoA thioesterase [Lysinibacillus]KOS61183.1 acyl-CoA hydrolase [Lysinibacillus sp. FJAT-14222]QQP12446.1 acyl-CoA thioesterase [Lysinibacillus agricola]